MDTIISILAGAVMLGLGAYFVGFLAYLRDPLRRLDKYR